MKDRETGDTFLLHCLVVVPPHLTRRLYHGRSQLFEVVAFLPEWNIQRDESHGALSVNLNLLTERNVLAKKRLVDLVVKLGALAPNGESTAVNQNAAMWLRAEMLGTLSRVLVGKREEKIR